MPLDVNVDSLWPSLHVLVFELSLVSLSTSLSVVANLYFDTRNIVRKEY